MKTIIEIESTDELPDDELTENVLHVANLVSDGYREGQICVNEKTGEMGWWRLRKTPSLAKVIQRKTRT